MLKQIYSNVYLFNLIFLMYLFLSYKQKSKTKEVSSVKAKSSFWHFPPRSHEVIVAAQDWIQPKTIRLRHRDPRVNRERRENASSSKVYSADYFQQQWCHYGFSLICFVNAHLGQGNVSHRLFLPQNPPIPRAKGSECPVGEARTAGGLTL